MAEAGSQDYTDGLNVPGELNAQKFEDVEGNKAIDGNEEQTSSELLDTGHSQDSLGPRQRILTEKGKEERLNWLKQQRVNALRAVSRKRTEVSEFMVDINNLYLVKNELINLNDLIEQYKDAFHAYHEELTDGGDKDREHARHDEKIKDIMAYLHPVYAWVSQAEGRLADQLERASSKGSKASKASSQLSARDRERVRLAELKAERSMLKQKQALRAAEEDLELQLEIVKAEAREKALNEIDREQEVPPPSCSSGPPSVVASFSPIVVSSVPTSLPNVLAFSPKALDSTAHNPAFAETQEKSTLQGTRNTGATDAATESPYLIQRSQSSSLAHLRTEFHLHRLVMVQKPRSKSVMESLRFSHLS